MRKIILILLLIFLGCKREVQPNEILFNKINSTPIVTLHLNGKYSRILVDTGATMSILHEGEKDKYNFKTHIRDDKVSGIGGTTNIYDVTNLTVTYRDSILKIPFKAADLSHVRRGIGVVGIVGSDWLKRNKAVISYKDNIISLE